MAGGIKIAINRRFDCMNPKPLTINYNDLGIEQCSLLSNIRCIKRVCFMVECARLHRRSYISELLKL